MLSIFILIIGVNINVIWQINIEVRRKNYPVHGSSLFSVLINQNTTEKKDVLPPYKIDLTDVLI